MDEVLQIRMEMLLLGWKSHDRIMPGEDRIYQIWFERWDWHGKACDRACYNGICRFDEILNCVKSTAEKAKEAWEKFPEKAPWMDRDGNLRI